MNSQPSTNGHVVEEDSLRAILARMNGGQQTPSTSTSLSTPISGNSVLSPQPTPPPPPSKPRSVPNKGAAAKMNGVVTTKTNNYKAKKGGNLSVASPASNGISVKDEGGPGPSTEPSSLQLFLQEFEIQKEAAILQKNLELAESRKPKWFRRELVPPEIVEQTRSLPIYSKRDELIELIKKNQVVIIVGETGCGKSTQIPQYLADAGMAGDFSIAVTQPRRVAAKSLATRVAQECGVNLGTLVGFAVRFESNVSSNTVIKYMTDGMLVKDCTQEPNLDSYSVIMIDEAHERSIHTDVCFGLLKRAAKNRSDIRIIISSATLEKDKFSKFFNNAPVFSVTGNEYDVQVNYKPPRGPGPALYLENIILTILDIHASGKEGDILVFLTGLDEIDSVWESLNKLMGEHEFIILTVVPCHGSLPLESQQKMFEKTPAGSRKVVLATNIAETSVTIEGIVFVVDCGFVKENRYNSATKIDSLVTIPITKFQAIQRQGRAGRTQPGECYRLYSEDTFKEFKEAQEPDIKRSNVDSTMLDLISLGVQNPMEFEFMDAPPADAIFEALISLRDLKALDDTLALTPLGQQMASFPLDPSLAKVLITSAKLGCPTEMLKIVSVLSTQYQHLFYRDSKSRAEADLKKATFHQPEGDHLTLLKVYDEWMANRYSEDWCRENFIQYRYLLEAKEIRKQLRDIMIKYKLLNLKGQSHSNCPPNLLKEHIGKAFTAGYFFQLAKRKGSSFVYQKISSSGEKKDVFLHPSCCLFKVKPEWIIFHEVMETTKAFVKGAMSIKPGWVKYSAPEFVKKAEAKYNVKF